MAHQAHQVPAGDAYSTGGADASNRAAQAGNAAAHQAGHAQKHGEKSKISKEELARIVAEENESKGRLPRYPGLERWQLTEKMGDGAFSNVYRARDLDGVVGEVAIKVVRKFEMNSAQVSTGKTMSIISFPPLLYCYVLTNTCGRRRVMIACIRNFNRSNQRLLRCANIFILPASKPSRYFSMA